MISPTLEAARGGGSLMEGGCLSLYVVEKYKLDIVRFTSTHNLDSGTSVVERGWTLF